MSSLPDQFQLALVKDAREMIQLARAKRVEEFNVLRDAYVRRLALCREFASVDSPAPEQPLLRADIELELIRLDAELRNLTDPGARQLARILQQAQQFQSDEPSCS